CSTKEGELCVNGMSNRSRDSGTANSGILCDVRTEDFGSSDVLAGVRFQEKYERLAFINGGGDFTPPRCSMGEFLSDEASDGSERVRRSLPDFAYEALREAVPDFGRKIKGYDDPSAVITAVETRSSSPVRILRNETGESNIRGIYPAGEGAGYAGGITSAACDGIRAAWHAAETGLPITAP
ncbi:MAG: NAD(FAD)-utilizing dehydrogenase, partial [Clostridiales bacterium]|nr:NAD(FAD)-utilizing dehydrogenase [Clostridiales bacterium]